MVAQQYLIADAITRGLFQTNLPTFLGLRQDFGGSYNTSNNSDEITARELIDAMFGGTAGVSSTYGGGVGLPGVLKNNFRANGAMMVASVVGIPIAFKVGMQLLRKPIIAPANKMLKSVGLTGVKV